MTVKISVIVPVLNEEAIIRSFLEHLKSVAWRCEVIIVDGGSTDRTRHIAEEYFPVVTASTGRARQMNAGASLACGEILWFLHADCAMPEMAVEDILSALEDRRIVAGCFRLRLSAKGAAYRICDDLGNLAVDVTGLSCGDHGIFVRRDAFEAAGRYTDLSIMEDLDLTNKLKGMGRFVQLRSYIVSEPRKWRKNGACRTTGVYILLIALYLLRVPMPVLYRIYKRLK